MARPLPSVDAVVARVKELAAEEACKTAAAADSMQTYTDDVAQSLQKLAKELRAEASVQVSVQDVLNFAQAVSR